MAYKRKRVSRPRYAKRARRAGKSRRGGMLLRTMRRVALRAAETKFANKAAENVQLFHNTGTLGNHVFLSNIAATGQGTQQYNRLGDVITARSIVFKMWFSTKQDRPNVMFRVIVFNPQHDTLTAANPTGFWMNNSPNKMLDEVNTDRYRVIKDFRFHSRSQAVIATIDSAPIANTFGREQSTLKTFSIPLRNKRIQYQTDNGAIPKSQGALFNLAVIAYDAYGTLTSDGLASMAYNVRMYFKDL